LSKKYFDGDLKPFGGIFRTLDWNFVVEFWNLKTLYIGSDLNDQKLCDDFNINKKNKKQYQ
jgi:hypothetical protein